MRKKEVRMKERDNFWLILNNLEKEGKKGNRFTACTWYCSGFQKILSNLNDSKIQASSATAFLAFWPKDRLAYIYHKTDRHLPESPGTTVTFRQRS